MTRTRPARGVEILRCRSCRATMRPPRLLCPSCGSGDLERSTTKGAGTVFAHTAVGSRAVTLVDLDEGELRLLGVSPTGAHELSVGMRVTLTESDGVILVCEAEAVDG